MIPRLTATVSVLLLTAVDCFIGTGQYGASLGRGFAQWGGFPGFGFPWQAPPVAYQLSTDSIYGVPGIGYYQEPRWRYQNHITGGTGFIRGTLNKDGLTSYPVEGPDAGALNVDLPLPPILAGPGKPNVVILPSQANAGGLSQVTIVGGVDKNNAPLAQSGFVNSATGSIVSVGENPSLTSVIGTAGINSIQGIAGNLQNTATGAKLSGHSAPRRQLVASFSGENGQVGRSVFLPSLTSDHDHELPTDHQTLQISNGDAHPDDIHDQIKSVLSGTGGSGSHSVKVGVPQSVVQGVATGTSSNVVPVGPGGPGSLTNDPNGNLGLGQPSGSGGSGGVGTDAGGPRQEVINAQTRTHKPVPHIKIMASF